MGIAKYFDVVCGMDQNDSFDKAKLILKCIKLCNRLKEESLFIADTNNDFIGSQKAGVKFLGVTYGFGFIPKLKYEGIEIVNTVSDLLQYLIKDINVF